MHFLNPIWNKIILNGSRPSDSQFGLKQVSFINGLFFIAFSAYIIFFIGVLLVTEQHHDELWISNIIILSAFFACGVLMYFGKRTAAKMLLMFCIYSGIFFYDNFFGGKAGVFVYYFAFSVAAATLFSWKTERALLILFLLVPLVLFYITHISGFRLVSHVNVSEKFISVLRLFNFGLAFLVFSGYGVIIINFNRISEEKLHQSGINLQTLLDNTSANIWSINKNYELIAYNRAFSEAISIYYNKEVHEGFHMRNEVFSLPNYSAFLKEVHEKALTGIPSSGEFVTNKTRFEILASPLYDVNGNITGATFYDRDITERKRKDAELQLLGINLQSLIDNMPGSTWSIDKDYKIISGNNLFCSDMRSMFGAEITMGFDMKLLTERSDFPETFRNHQNRTMNGEQLYDHYTYEGVHYEIYGTPLKDMQGRVIGATFYVLDISQRMQTEQRIEQMGLNLQTLIDNTQGGIWSVDKNYRVIAVNKSFRESMKKFFNVDFNIGYNIMELHARKDFPELFKKHHTDVFEGNEIFEEYEFNGNYYEIFGKPLKDAEGNPAGATFYNVNISQRKKYQHQLEQIGINLQTLIDNTGNSIWSIDRNYKVIAASRVYKEDMKRLFDADIHEGFDVRTLFTHPAYPAEWQQQYLQVFNGEDLLEKFSYDKKHYELYARPILDTKQKVIGAAFYASDVTRRRNSELQLQQSEINLQTLIDNNYGSTWGIDSNYKILACNAQYKKDLKELFGVNPVPGFDIRELFNRSDYPQQWKGHYERVLSGHSLFETYELNGRIYELTAVPIHNAKGQLAGAALHAADVTKTKKNERELIAAKEKAEDASKAKAQFLSNMSHELRTPLNGIIGIVNIMLSEKHLEAQKEQLDILKYSSDHMLSLVNDILDFNKIEAGKVELDKSVFNLSAILDKTAIVFEHEARMKDLSFSAEIDRELDREVIGDVTRLRQVLNNLLSNAIKFTEKGGIGLKAGVAERIGDSRCVVFFNITDTGIGIDKSKLERIFDSFTQADAKTTRKYGGTGLGLTISKKLIDLMDSKLEVTSKPGEGSTFSFKLLFECAPAREKAKAEKGLLQLEEFSELSVLVAEDNPVNMIVVKRILEKWNIKVAEAENGAVALEKMKQADFDLILMDMEMPVMDGLTAVEKIRQTDTVIPIIALTAASFENMHHFLRSKGLNDFVQKPFRPEDLHQKINRLLNLA
jgi:signal transduction histidine kinase/CheY-like chemotaxis protein